MVWQQQQDMWPLAGLWTHLLQCLKTSTACVLLQSVHAVWSRHTGFIWELVCCCLDQGGVLDIGGKLAGRHMLVKCGAPGDQPAQEAAAAQSLVLLLLMFCSTASARFSCTELMVRLPSWALAVCNAKSLGAAGAWPSECNKQLQAASLKVDLKSHVCDSAAELLYTTLLLHNHASAAPDDLISLADLLAAAAAAAAGFACCVSHRAV